MRRPLLELPLRHVAGLRVDETVVVHRLLERVRAVSAARVVAELGRHVRQQLLAPLVLGVASVHVVSIVLQAVQVSTSVNEHWRDVAYGKDRKPTSTTLRRDDSLR